MVFLIKVILIAALTYVSELFLPWWSAVICAFLVGLALRARGINAFLSGFLGVGLLWMVYAWLIDIETNAILTTKLANLFQLNQPVILIVITAFIGAIVGGMGSLCGNLFRRIFEPDRSDAKYY